MTKRIMTIVLTLLMLLSIVAGCGKSAETQETAVSETEQAASAEKASAEETPAEAAPAEEAPAEEETPVEAAYFPLGETETFRWFMSTNSTLYSRFEDFYAGTPFWQYLAEQTNVNFEFVTTENSEMKTNLQLMLTAGEYTDLYSSFASNYYGGFAAAIEDGIISPLNDYMDQWMPNYKAVTEANDDYYVGIRIDSGDVVQFSHLTNEARVNQGMVTRGDWLDELGIDYHDVVTYDDYHDMLTRMKDELGHEGALFLNSSGCTDNSLFSNGFGVNVSVFSTIATPFSVIDGEIHFSPLDEGFIEYLRLMRDWYSEGLIYQDFLSYARIDNDLLLTDSTATYAVYAYNMTALDAISEDEDFHFVPLSSPKLNADDPIYITGPLSLVSGEGAALSAQCEDPETLCRFFDYFYGEEGNTLANYGVEGVAYEVVDGEISMNDCVTKDENALGWYIYTMPTKMPFVEIFSRAFVGYTDYQMEAYDMWIDYGADDFGCYTIPMAAEFNADEGVAFASAYGDIGTLTTEFMCSYIVGTAGDAEYEAYCETVQSMDLQTCIDCKQSAYDRYADKYATVLAMRG